MTNGEYITKIVEQDEDFCVLTNDVDETVTIEVSLDWWNNKSNAPIVDVLNKIRAEIEQNAYPIVHGVNNHEKGMTLYGILQIIDKYR